MILRGGRTPEQHRQFLEQKQHLQGIGKSLGEKLGIPFYYIKMRDMVSSKGGEISITSPERQLFLFKKMGAVSKNKLVKKNGLIGDGKSNFEQAKFEAIGEAFEWKCEIYLSFRGNAPAAFRTAKATVWLLPVILEKANGESEEEEKAGDKTRKKSGTRGGKG